MEPEDDNCYFEIDSCPKCGRIYGEIDFEFQRCHICGWDVIKNEFNNYKH